ncbi:PREDICTED: leukocyte surface antigen CD53-like [Trachymyrmex cornetzi]|uniref:CD63 antigen n=1 Tax=Trachymyrmex cornetzi TaxID=471704 RepID=A0A195E631_9HYME|nr:PREDICTED: leukocyte surface antigen CD53-like [Trachymyrmex cornetzi]XP_018362104.1 PREDICTED: leukocyte surface antigen CD53-like [Trachymyrmex cornetzi]KYN20546.1 CD63 antigen [Trachymyrmex cornetzi]
MGRDENENEIETDTDDDELVTESDETISTEKSSKNIGTSTTKLFCKWLPKKCLKFFFLLLNSVVLLTGVTAITIAIWMLTDANFTSRSRLLSQQLFMTILLILGVFVSLVAFTGIIGITKKKDYFMIFYLMCQSIALCAVFICLTMSFPFFDMITKKIRDDMNNSMENYQSLDWAVKAWDNTHRYLKCCGIKSSKDWLDHQINIPQSCCSISLKLCLHMTENVSYKSGCLKGAYILLKSYVQTASISTLVIFPLLLISVLLAFGLRKRLKTSQLIMDEATYS